MNTDNRIWLALDNLKAVAHPQSFYALNEALYAVNERVTADKETIDRLESSHALMNDLHAQRGNTIDSLRAALRDENEALRRQVDEVVELQSRLAEVEARTGLIAYDHKDWNVSDIRSMVFSLKRSDPKSPP